MRIPLDSSEIVLGLGRVNDTRSDAEETPGRQLRVLLVEDNDEHAELVSIHLARIRGYQFALDRCECLEDTLQTLGSQRFDAVLLDLNLPDSTGSATCRRVCDAAPDTPVVVMSSASMPDEGSHLLRDHAEDYFPKSKMDGELLFRAILCAVERWGRRKAESGWLYANGQLEAAREVQMQLLPTEPPRVPNFEIAASCWPAEYVSGDYFDFLRGADGTLGIAIGDAAGHGTRAATLMAVSAGCVRSAFNIDDDLGTVMSRINSVLTAHPPAIPLMTLLLTRLNPLKRTLVYSSAGHPHGYLFDRHGSLSRKLDEINGVSLGVISGATYVQSGPIQILPGELLVLVSDGVLEAGLGCYGDRRLQEVIASHPGCSAESAIARIDESLRNHLGGQPHADDMTVLAVRALDDA